MKRLKKNCPVFLFDLPSNIRLLCWIVNLTLPFLSVPCGTWGLCKLNQHIVFFTASSEEEAQEEKEEKKRVLTRKVCDTHVVDERQ